MPSTTLGLPNSILGRIEFFEQRIADWNTDPGAIGLTPQQVLELTGRLAAARNAYNAAQQSRIQARNDTATQTQAVADLSRFGGDLIATIRAFADLQSDPLAVYTEADLEQPKAKGSPLPPPVPATDLAATLQQSGAVRVSWKGTVANGTFYDVYRRLEGQPGFALIGSSASRSYTDTAVPAGTVQCSYYTIARRDSFSSPESQQAVIRFGMQIQPGGQSGSGQLGLAA